MNRVCLDTNVLIWGIKQESTPGQEKKIETVKNLLQELHNENAEIFIPTICVAELLSGTSEKHQLSVLAALQHFKIIPFDIGSSLKYDKVWGKRKSTSELTGCRRDIKADAMIVACALQHKISTIYTGDKDLEILGKNFIDLVYLE